MLGFNRHPRQVALAVGTAMILDMALHQALRGGWPLFPLSAAITGLSLSILVNFAHGLWYALVPVALAIGSKYVFTFRGHHLYNPALFGVVASLKLSDGMLSDAPAYQWGGSYAVLAFVVTLALLLFVFRIRRGTLIVSFLAFYFVALTVRAWITRWHMPFETWFMGALSSPAFFLFTFFMITDPKTTVRTKSGQCVVAFCVALAEFILRLDQVVYAPIFALFFVGPAANLIEIWWDSRRKELATN